MLPALALPLRRIFAEVPAPKSPKETGANPASRLGSNGDRPDDHPLKNSAKLLLNCSHSLLKRPGVHADRQHPASQLDATARMVGVARQDRPRHMIRRGGAGRRSTAAHMRGCSHSPGMPIDWLRSAGPIKRKSRSAHGRDALDVFDGLNVFDLHCDNAFGVGAAEVFAARHGPVTAVGAGAVDAATAARMELGPAIQSLRPGGRCAPSTP